MNQSREADYLSAVDRGDMEIAGWGGCASLADEHRSFVIYFKSRQAFPKMSIINCPLSIEKGCRMAAFFG